MSRGLCDSPSISVSDCESDLPFRNRIVREIGAKSSVLLKNKNDTLPLNKPRRLVMIGTSLVLNGRQDFGSFKI